MERLSMFHIHRELRNKIMKTKPTDQSYYEFLFNLNLDNQLIVLSWEFDFHVFFIGLDFWHSSELDLCNNMLINALTPYITKYAVVSKFISIIHKMNYAICTLDGVEKITRLDELSIEYHNLRSEFINVIHTIIKKADMHL